MRDRVINVFRSGHVFCGICQEKSYGVWTYGALDRGTTYIEWSGTRVYRAPLFFCTPMRRKLWYTEQKEKVIDENVRNQYYTIDRSLRNKGDKV